MPNEAMTAKAVATSATPNTPSTPSTGKNTNGKRGRNDRRKQGRNRKPRVEAGRNNVAAATTVATNNPNAPTNDKVSDKDENVKTVMTRLTDNHPLTMEDRDPRYYLQHLTEDQLEENVPVFEEDREEMPDEFATTKRRVTKDAFGHKVEVVETIPSQKEQDLASSGVYFPNDTMYGYTPDTPLVLTVKDDLVDYDDKDDLAAGIITNKDGEVISSKSGETTVETKADEPTQEEPGSNDLQEMTEDGDYLAASPLVPGGAVQTEIEVHRDMQQAYGRRTRQEHRRMVLGYDHRQFGNAEPWGDTHRIEAIDARLRELHLQRESGALEYPIEKDAAAEAKRIREEEARAVAKIREAIGVKAGEVVDTSVTLPAEKKRAFSVKGKSLQSLRARHTKRAVGPAVDASLNAMAVVDIPVEKLYQARQQELERLRQTRYEDYDLEYLLAKSGKTMKRTGDGASLYELSHGETSQTRRATKDEEANPLVGAERLGKHLSEEEKLNLVHELELFEKFGRLTEDEVLGLYNTGVQVITPEMEKAASEEKEEAQGAGDVSLNHDLFANKDKIAQTILNTRAPAASEDEVSQADIAVDLKMDEMERDPTKPLRDTEMGVMADGSLVVARRRRPSAFPNYARDKKEFMEEFDEAINREVSEKDKAELKKLVITDKDIEASREAIGLPKDLSKKEFYKRYLRRWKQHKNDGEIVSELMTGYSVEHPEKMLKDLGVDTEEGIEKYLMDTFNRHEAEANQLIPPDKLETLELLQQSSKVLREAEKKLEELKKSEGEASGEKKEGEASEEKKEGEGEKSEEVKEEAKEGEASEEKKEGEVKEGEEAKEEVKEVKEENKEEQKNTDTPDNEMDELPHYDPYEHPEDPVKALDTMQERFYEAEARAERMTPFYDDANADHHIVDALEYSGQVYVHEKDREMIYRMYQQGLHPKEISQSFGFDEGRVNAILRLMKAREGKKKAGLYTEKAVKEIEDSEDVFEYEYRDFPPADYKRAEKRREVKSLPRNLPRFVFLNEEDDEVKVMREVDRLIRRRKQEKQPEIKRVGLPVGKSGYGDVV